jgi:hypothetical protein
MAHSEPVCAGRDDVLSGGVVEQAGVPHCTPRRGDITEKAIPPAVSRE